MSAGVGYLLFVYVCVCGGETACDRLLDAITVCVCVSMRGAGAAGLLYHSPGCGLDSSHQDVRDCVMSV